MKRSLPILLVIVITLFSVGCLSAPSSSTEAQTPDAQFSDGTVSATLELARNNKSATVKITNESASVIEFAWHKSSYNGGSVIASQDVRNPNAQPIPDALLQPGATATKILLPKSAALFVSGDFYRQMPWGDHYKQGNFTFAYTIDGEQHFVTL